MAIPGFQSITLPLLAFAADGGEHTTTEAVDALAVQFQLSEEERRQLLPSGRQATFSNRVAWAGSYLRKAGLMETLGRGRFRITDRGKEVLAATPPRIDIPFLMQYPEFRAFRAPPDRYNAPPAEAGAESEVPPQELLENTYLQLRSLLQQELLDRVKAGSARYFEQLVVNLLVAMGYGGSLADAARVGRSGDGGIDGIIKEDKLGLDAVYVQAKKYEGPVPTEHVRAFSGSLDAHRARKGVFITTSRFPESARAYVNNIEKKIVLIDGPELSRLMIEHGIGVVEVASYAVKRLDETYFEDEA